MADKARLEIPAWQQYACTGCGRCCRQGFEIWLPASEKERLSNIDWSATDFARAGIPLFRPTPRGWRIDLDKTGACRFLDADNLCRMHAAIGFEKKPLTCKQFPLVFGHAPGVHYLGVLFSCPAICDNEGKPLSRQKSLARDLLAERSQFLGPPDMRQDIPFDTARTIPHATLRTLETALVRLLSPEETAAESPTALAQRCLRAAALIDAVDEMTSLELESADVIRTIDKLCKDAQATTFSPTDIRAFSAKQRALFRQACGLVARAGETGLLQPSVRSRFGARWRRFQIATRYLLGVGFGLAARVDIAFDTRGADLIRRYLATRIWTRTYLGSTFAGLSALQGLRVTLLTVPLALWHARLYATEANRETISYEDLREGIITVDLTFGHRPDLGGTTARLLATLCTPVGTRRALAHAFNFK